MAIGLYRTEWRGSLTGQFRENVMHWRLDPDPAANPFDTANDLALALNTTFKPLWLAMMPPDYALDALMVRRIQPTGGCYATIDYVSLTEIGTRGAEALSQQLCPCVSLIPPMGIKSAGRVFLPAVAKTDIQLNVYLNTYRTAVSNFFTPAIAGFSVSGGTAKLGIYSRKTNTSSDAITFNLSPALGYQRKRARPSGA
jgi:hypothetical protein